MYEIIIYELVLLKISQNNRVITKKYFKRIASYKNIELIQLSDKAISLKNDIYRDSKYILSFVKLGEKDTFYINLNKKSEKYYNMIYGL